MKTFPFEVKRQHLFSFLFTRPVGAGAAGCSGVVWTQQVDMRLAHGRSVSRAYRGVRPAGGAGAEPERWELRPALFHVPRAFRHRAGARARRRRPAPSHLLDSEVIEVRSLFEKLQQELNMTCDEPPCDETKGEFDSKELSKKIFESTNIDFIGKSGKNINPFPVKCEIDQEIFLIPHKSRFLCGNAAEQVEKLRNDPDCKFDIVIADPPWWNKYIRRLKTANRKLSYSMMYNHDIASIPVKDCLAENCLVAVWCTNSPTNRKAVREEIFPSWGVEYVATWYWMKVTNSFEPVCDFGTTNQKQPYERIMIGKVGKVRDVLDKQVIVSVPSVLHSHKPPILDLLSPYLEVAEPLTLELFARYLLPNTVSVGFEPLKWQHISLFQRVI